MKVGYDISVLGMGHYSPRARTGIFRYVENLGDGLGDSEECELFFCAVESWQKLFDALDYLQVNTRFSQVPFLPPRFSKLTNVRRFLDRNLHELNSRIDSPQIPAREQLTLRVLRRPLFLTRKSLDWVPYSHGLNELKDVDLFHSPFFPLPDQGDGSGRLKRFLTVYDLVPILYPQFFEFHEDHLLHRILQSLKHEDWVLCISHSTKNDLCNYLKFDPARVFVTHPAAASDFFYLCSDVEKIEMTKKKYKIPEAPYILSVNTLEPRKNIDHAIRCFARLVQENNIDLNFVLVGTKGWDYAKIFHAISDSGSIKERIILTGYVADEDLAALYSGAQAFVYPSFYEGFGLPPLEAMQCGLPIITSNTSSIPEVVGDAAIMLDPLDMDGLADSIFRIYKNPSLRAEMSARSIARAAQFSWDRCTQQTIAAYRVAFGN